jgi:hypothetical protein
MTASPSAVKRITTSAIQKIFTFVRKAEAMPGSDSRKISRLKNASLTSSQPGDVTTATAMRAKKTSVETTAIVTARPPEEPPVRLPTIFEPRSSLSALLQDRRGARQPLRLVLL